MKQLIITLLLAFCWSAHSTAQESSPAPAKAGVTYGKSFKKSGAKSVRAVENALEKSDKFTGKLQGKVTRVCTSKGCWLALQSEDSDKPVVVRFKDYSFFVPQDIVGKTVVVEGYAKGKEKKDDDGNIVKDIAFTADGVIVVK